MYFFYILYSYFIEYFILTSTTTITKLEQLLMTSSWGISSLLVTTDEKHFTSDFAFFSVLVSRSLPSEDAESADKANIFAIILICYLLQLFDVDD